jgi:Scavenger receptor cysteine-rich domain
MYLMFYLVTIICVVMDSWTDTDVNVACQQLGFLTGNFSFVSWARNDSLYMLYHKPACSGSELSVLDCPAASNICIGSRICSKAAFIALGRF